MNKKLPAWIVLTVIALVAALALGFTYESTKDPIAAQEAEKAMAVRQSLLKDASSFNKVEGVDAIAGATITSNAVVTAYNEAYAASNGQAGTFSASAKGFAGQVQVDITTDESGVVTDVKIGQNADFNETAGFGLKAKEDQAYAAQFVGKSGKVANGDFDVVYEGVNANGEVVGYIATETVMGFANNIEVTVASDKDAKLFGINVGGASFEETPGLGAKSKEPAFMDQFAGKEMPVDLVKNEGEIDAITAATITSSAVVRGVNAAGSKIGALAGFSLESAASVTELGDNRYGTATKGFAGNVYVELQLDANGAITEIIIGDDSFAETAGYGAKAKEEAFWGQFIGKSGTLVYGEGVDAIAGATITSNAVLTSVNNILLYHADPVAFAAAQAAEEAAAAPAEEEKPATGANEYAVQGDGLTGKIDIVVTMNDDGTIAKVDVKGTDSDMDASFLANCQTEAFLGQFVGKTIPVEGIDTVAGATVSSNGIINAVNTVVVAAPAVGNEYAVQGDGLTGKIDIVVTMNDDGTIAKVDVKGTDSDMDASFLANCQTEAFLGQFVGKTIPVEGIDTVAGATVSSNGIINAVNTVAAAEAPAAEEAPVAEEVQGTEYRASADGFTGLVTVAVTVADDGTIAKVAVKGTDSEYDEAFVAKCETDAFLGQFVGKTIPVDGIDIVAGATASSNAIIAAVNKVVVEAPAAEEAPAAAGTEYAVQGDGLTGKIDIVVTMNDDGTIAGVAVKGTDSDMDAAFLAKCDDAFLSQFVGKTIPVEGIDTVAGATVSSNGIINAVNTIEAAAPAAPAAEETADKLVRSEIWTVGQGLTGQIELKVTVEADGTIAKVEVEGTDSEMDAAFLAKCDEAFLSQFVGKTIPVEGIDVVAGATVSSNGIINAVNSLAESAGKSGHAVASAQGFAGPVAVDVTVENGMITALVIGDEQFAETEGFGAKAKEEAFINQFMGKTLPIQKTDIDAIAGATITTDAVIAALNKAYEKVQ